MSTPLFLLGVHRGGTTFVQRLLNCHPAVTVWGENGGFLTGLRRAVNGEWHPVDAQAFAEFSGFADRVVSWASPIDTAEFGSAVARFIEGIYATAPVWGFKEIRHSNLDDIEFLKTLFPTAKLVLLRRQPRDVLMSQLHVGWSNAPVDTRLEAWVDRFVASYHASISAFDATVQRWPHDAIAVSYEDVRDLPSVLSLFDRLDISRDAVDHALIDAVLRAKVNSSYLDVGREVPPELRDRVLTMFKQATAPG